MPEHEHEWVYVEPVTDGRRWRCEQCDAEQVLCFNCGVPILDPPRGPCAGHGTAFATYD